jgi:outer membrane biosynthesis protein TonB
MASEALIDAYIDLVATRVSDARSDIALARYDQVTVAFDIAPDGSPRDIKVRSASTPLAAEAARNAVLEAAPYPPPPFDMRSCLLWGRMEVSLYSSGRCDEARAEEYLDRVTRGIQAAVERKQLAAKYDGDVILRVDIARDGAIESVIAQRASSEPAGAAVADAAREIARFDPPHELIQDCVAEGPFLVWIPLTELPQ